MRTASFLQLFAILILIAFVSSCKKHDCPDPVDTTTYVATLKGASLIDAFVTDLNPTNNTSTSGRLDALAWTENGVPFVERIFIKFDYSSIPSGATIKKATLTLYADTTTWHPGHSTLSGSNEFYLRRITSDWTASTLNWNNKPTNDESTQLTLPESTSYKQTYTIDVTNFVKDEISTPATAFGFTMQLVTESYYRAVIFGSSENADSNLRPNLEIEYSK